mmetsp:Transcript_19373/g.29884  ORF Transcript_19373/g.29884 Transcript_19373/m.29884 type:complete len:136 (+) Transcript_19373:349-756(+)
MCDVPKEDYDRSNCFQKSKYTNLFDGSVTYYILLRLFVPYKSQLIAQSTISTSSHSPSPESTVTFGVYFLIPSLPPTRFSSNNLWALGYHHLQRIAPTANNTLLPYSNNTLCHPPTPSWMPPFGGKLLCYINSAG